jgi:predicted SprT family Zn-dependent metalloprotease
METIMELRKTFDEVVAELIPIFPEIKNINYLVIFNTRAIKRYGQCKRKGSNYFEININKAFAKHCKIEDVKNTIVHEILHSLPNGMTHKGKWLMYANKINTLLPHYRITRTNSYEGYADTKPTPKYIVSCPHCEGAEWDYYRTSEVVKNLLGKNTRGYHCPRCKRQDLQIKVNY